MTQTFLHVDMDAFFTSVEQHDHPELRGRPVVVGSPPDQRGVVAAASYEARKFGIHSAMPSREAGRLCPGAVFITPNGGRYQEVSDVIMKILERFTPLIEPVSIDEAFLDVTGAKKLFGSGAEIARKIKTAIKRETGLTASVGVASNKFLAKIASDLEKPDGLTVVPEGAEKVKKFLAPMPVGRIWGVGEVTERVLATAGIRTIGDLQVASRTRLSDLFGAAVVDDLVSLANGEDSRAIELDRDEKSISREHTFAEDVDSPETIENVLRELVDDVASRLRTDGKQALLARLKLRWRGFKTITRQRPFPSPCCDDFSLREMALTLFREQDLIKPVRLVGFGVGRLTAIGAASSQLSLFEQKPENQNRKEALSRAMDSIRHRFSDSKMVRPASIMKTSD